MLRYSSSHREGSRTELFTTSPSGARASLWAIFDIATLDKQQGCQNNRKRKIFSGIGFLDFDIKCIQCQFLIQCFISKVSRALCQTVSHRHSSHTCIMGPDCALIIRLHFLNCTDHGLKYFDYYRRGVCLTSKPIDLTGL